MSNVKEKKDKKPAKPAITLFTMLILCVVTMFAGSATAFSLSDEPAMGISWTIWALIGAAALLALHSLKITAGLPKQSIYAIVGILVLVGFIGMGSSITTTQPAELTPSDIATFQVTGAVSTDSSSAEEASYDSQTHTFLIKVGYDDTTNTIKQIDNGTWGAVYLNFSVDAIPASNALISSNQIATTSASASAPKVFDVATGESYNLVASTSTGEQRLEWYVGSDASPDYASTVFKVALDQTTPTTVQLKIVLNGDAIDVMDNYDTQSFSVVVAGQVFTVNVMALPISA